MLLVQISDTHIDEPGRLVYGHFDTAAALEEAIDEIQKRLQDIFKHIDKNRLIAAPDCGLGHLPRWLAIKKLKTLVEAVKDI